MTRRPLLCALALAVACAGATDGKLGGLGGRCHHDEVDGAPADGFVSRPGAWLRVRRIDLPSRYRQRETRAFEGAYDVVGGDARAVTALGKDTVTSLRMHGTIASDAANALALTPDVYAHVGPDATEAEFAVALTRDDFAFLGECQRRLLTTPLREMLGPGAVETVRGFVGKRGDEVAAVIASYAGTAPARNATPAASTVRVSTSIARERTAREPMRRVGRVSRRTAPSSNASATT